MNSTPQGKQANTIFSLRAKVKMQIEKGEMFWWKLVVLKNRAVFYCIDFKHTRGTTLYERGLSGNERSTGQAKIIPFVDRPGITYEVGVGPFDVI